MYLFEWTLALKDRTNCFVYDMIGRFYHYLQVNFSLRKCISQFGLKIHAVSDILLRDSKELFPVEINEHCCNLLVAIPCNFIVSDCYCLHSLKYLHFFTWIEQTISAFISIVIIMFAAIFIFPFPFIFISLIIFLAP